MKMSVSAALGALDAAAVMTAAVAYSDQRQKDESKHRDAFAAALAELDSASKSAKKHKP